MMNVTIKGELINTQSHLYKGFEYVSLFPSIKEQRLIQSKIIKDIFHTKSDLNILSAGIGWGDELVAFLQNKALFNFNHIFALDLVNVYETFYEKLNELMLSNSGMDILINDFLNKFDFLNIDLLDIDSFFSDTYFDLIQCGFILEDIHYQHKEIAFKSLYNKLKSGGILVISEMFLDNNLNRNKSEVRKNKIKILYDFFIKEADSLLSNNILNNDQYIELMGNENKDGLIKSKKDAINGERDFFENYYQYKKRLENAGFNSIEFYPNPIFNTIGVIKAQKPYV